MNVAAAETVEVDIVPVLRQCYKHSVPHGGLLETEIPEQRLHIFDELVSRGLLFITVRSDNLSVYCISKKGAMLLPPKDLHECVHLTTLQWTVIKQETNVRPIFHGPFHSKLK